MKNQKEEKRLTEKKIKMNQTVSNQKKEKILAETRVIPQTMRMKKIKRMLQNQDHNQQKLLKPTLKK